MSIANGGPAAIIVLGLILGMRHATDPDHVIAVTTILSRERHLAAAARVGLIWGLGHTATVMVVGAAIIVFQIAIPARLGLAMEFAVALVLIALGASATRVFVREAIARLLPARASNDLGPTVHSHAHRHGGRVHRHPHVHPLADVARPDIEAVSEHNHLLPGTMPGGFAARRPMLRSFGVGLVHGLAGSAAIALLVLSAIGNELWATLYLLLFCVGTIIGMGIITTMIGVPFTLAYARMARLHRGLVIGSGLLSFGFGLLIGWRVGVTDQLFASLPH
ncbi:MAG TPA: hypothetical protein VJN94_02870 [Candidatus Binataceae bacterium]|nr:hypothetical protein [Candidatus Binataceae bacterium]